VRAKVREDNPGGTSKITGGVGFVKQVGFKAGVKQRELWMSRVANQKRKNKVMGK